MDGLDAVNPLSYLMLQATIDTQMVQPSLSVRLSRKNPEDFFLKIAELIPDGFGLPRHLQRRDRHEAAHEERHPA